MKTRSLMFISRLLAILYFAGCQPQGIPNIDNSLSKDLIQILDTNYYLHLPVGYQFDPFGGNSGDLAAFLITIRSPEKYPTIWIWPTAFGKFPYSFLTRSTSENNPEDFGEDFWLPEKIASDHLEIYMAMYTFQKDYESQTLAIGQVGLATDEPGEGLLIDVRGNFSQQEEGYQVLKELLQSITFVAPTMTVEP